MLKYIILIDSYLTASTKKNFPNEIDEGIGSRLRKLITSFMWYPQVNYLSVCYILVKLLYLANGIGQLFLLDSFLGFERFNFQLYGIQVLTKFINGDDWTSSERFPRVTICDFLVRQQTNVHRYTVQCVLPINLFNEKIFLFVWFWLLSMIIITLANIGHWSVCLASPTSQCGYVKRQLSSVDHLAGQRDAHAADDFTISHLRRDGLLVVRLVAYNAGGLVAADVLYGMWSNFGPEKRALSTLVDKKNYLRQNCGNIPGKKSMYADHSRWSKVKRLLIGQTISNDSRPEMERPEEI